MLTLTILALTISATDRPWVGDPTHGAQLYNKECAACHGNDARGGRVGVSLRDSARMSFLRDAEYFALVETGQGAKRADEHRFRGKISYLEIWDVIAYTRGQHMEIGQFFPKSSRYVVGDFTIDAHGLERIEKATGKALKDAKAYVFTFYDFPDEEGNLRYVPADPILLDQLDKKKKAGYLVFLPFETKGYSGEIGVGMDASGVITRIAVPHQDPAAELMNKSLSRFEGQGKKGQRTPLTSAGGKPVADLAADVFFAYLRAMETVTMYDRDENERTWADE